MPCPNPHPHALPPTPTQQTQAKITKLLKDQDISKATKSRKTQAKIVRLLENQENSKAILQHLEEELSNVKRGTDQVNMDLNENSEPGQTCAGKERNAAAPVSPVGEAWDFINMGA